MEEFRCLVVLLMSEERGQQGTDSRPCSDVDAELDQRGEDRAEWSCGCTI